MSDPVNDSEQAALRDEIERTRWKSLRGKILSWTLGIIGGAQTLYAVTGEDLKIQQVLFYLGSAVLAVPVSMACAGCVVLPVLWLYRRVKGLDEDDLRLRKVMFGLLAVGGAIAYIPLTSAGHWFDFSDSSGSGRTILAVAGLAVIAISIWQWKVNERRLRRLVVDLARRSFRPS